MAAQHRIQPCWGEAQDRIQGTLPELSDWNRVLGLHEIPRLPPSHRHCPGGGWIGLPHHQGEGDILVLNLFTESLGKWVKGECLKRSDPRLENILNEARSCSACLLCQCCQLLLP
ncbi:cullin-5 [Platysternon megacephalum]|uniref:Cullin-5 n=1 Tax=Platysternon megacephalum TaxID=55544 RepID=A0A4D9EN63_9SAUR|nr:cullin-5 [Platysternon megacephalum]